MRTWIDGRLLTDPTAPAIPVNDHGLTVGDAVFEAIKIVGGQPFALDLHLDRLLRSAKGLGITGIDVDSLREGVAAVLAGDPIDLGRIRITITAGPAPLGSGRGDTGPTSIIVAAPMRPMPDRTAVVTVPWARNEHSPLAGLKTTSYAENVIALAHAAEHGASEAIFANLAGHLCEGTGSNLFYVVGGELRTSTLASGCLAGVTRALLLEWYGGREVDEPIEVARGADEVFLVSTTRDVQAVHRWDDRELPAPGPVTLAAAARWREREPELLGL